MFGKKELDSLDEYRKAWDDAPERKAPAKATDDEPKAADTGAVTNVDDFDYGDTVKDTAKAEEIKAASTPEVDSIASDDAKRAVQTKPAAIVPEAKPEMTFKQAFAQEYKRYKADPSSPSTFDWNGKKFALKLMKGEVNKPVQTAKPAPAKAAEDSDEYSNGWKEDQSAAESSCLANSKPTPAKQSTFGSVMKAFLPPSVVGGDNSTDKPQVAKVASPVKTSSPSGRDYSGNAKSQVVAANSADKGNRI